MTQQNGTTKPIDLWPTPPFVPPGKVEKQPTTEPEAKPARRILLLSDLFAWWRNARERKLRAKIANLKMRLSATEEERDRLAEMNENMRQWMLASTATAAQVAGLLTQPAPEKPKRTGAYG